MVDPVEEFVQVDVDHDPPPRLHVLGGPARAPAGLSGSVKSTLANALEVALHDRAQVLERVLEARKL